MNAATLISESKPVYTQLCSRLHVARLELFGSGTRSDFDVAHSDLDFVVSFSPDKHVSLADRYLELAEGLERIFKRKVDHLTEGAIRNPILKASIEKSKKLVYAGS